MNKKGRVIISAWMLGGVILFSGMLLGCGHDPNHGIDMEEARAAAGRVHTPPDPSVVGPGHGG